MSLFESRKRCEGRWGCYWANGGLVGVLCDIKRHVSAGKREGDAAATSRSLGAYLAIFCFNYVLVRHWCFLSTSTAAETGPDVKGPGQLWVDIPSLASFLVPAGKTKGYTNTRIAFGPGHSSWLDAGEQGPRSGLFSMISCCQYRKKPTIIGHRVSRLRRRPQTMQTLLQPLGSIS